MGFGRANDGSPSSDQKKVTAGCIPGQNRLRIDRLIVCKYRVIPGLFPWPENNFVGGH